MPEQTNILICGAGIAGVSLAYTLAKRGIRDILLVDPQPPLSLTSDKSTECYRDFWPGPGNAMVRLMSHSIDLLEALAEQSGDAFRMNRRGYLYVTRNATGAAKLRHAAEEAASLGAGPADYISDPAHIQREYPYLAPDTVAVLHARRCGWLSAQQLGMYLLEQARNLGVQFRSAHVERLDIRDGRVVAADLNGVHGSEHIKLTSFVNCAGPYLANVGRLLGIDLPVFSERHVKLAFEDRLHAIPREAPMIINADPVTINWSAEERELLEEDPDTIALLAELAPGAHLRPEGEGASQWVLALWAYDAHPVEEVFPPPIPEQFAEIAMRGVAEIVPALQPYLQRPPRPQLDAGYYTKTRENRPLIGPLPIEGAYLLGALSGYGIMAACGAADLLAAHMLHEPLPEYAAAFLPSRYADPAYQQLLASWGESGQL
jgi:sarcosine oxidase, subunit beta